MGRLIDDMYGLLKTEDPNLEGKKSVVNQVFEEMDENSDGEITESEFVQSCLGQQHISKLLALKILDILVDEI